MATNMELEDSENEIRIGWALGNVTKGLRKLLGSSSIRKRKKLLLFSWSQQGTHIRR